MNWSIVNFSGISSNYIRDRTGLDVEVIDCEVVQNDCRSTTFPSIRLMTNVQGHLVTSDQTDSLWFDGHMDFLIATGVF